MKYYVYENWRAENKAVIHIGSCGYCNEGRGCHENPSGNKNGKWLGPFDSLGEAEKAARKTGRAVREHKSGRCV
jgi:hypothetical protein